MSRMNTTQTAEHVARSAAASPAGAGLVRFGYAVKGVVYLIIGALAARVAIGDGGKTTDRKGALNAIYTEPFGKTLLWVVIVGLLAYALWNVARALLDLDHKGRDAKGILTRIIYIGIGISYGTLAFAAWHLVSGSGGTGKSSDASTQDWTARLLGQSFGPLLVEVVGALVCAMALYLFGKAYKASFKDSLELGQASARMRSCVIGLGRLGHAALGVVFGEIGVFLILAGYRHNAREAKGVGGSLQQLTREPYGHPLLGLVALGLVAYGLFAFTQARYRRINTA